MCLRRREGETNAIESDVTSIANTHAVLCPPTHRSIPHKQLIVFQVIVGLYHDDLWANPGGDTEKLEEAVKQRDGADAKVAAKAAAGAKGGRKSATKSGDRVAALRNSGKKRGKKSGNNGGKKDRGHAEEAANEAVAAVAAAAAAVAAGMVASENKDEEGDAGEDEEGRGMRVLGSMDEDDMVNLMDEDDPFCKDNAASADATVATVAAVGVDQPPKLVAVAKASAVVESTSTAVTASHGEVGEGGRGGGDLVFAGNSDALKNEGDGEVFALGAQQATHRNLSQKEWESLQQQDQQQERDRAVPAVPAGASQRQRHASIEAKRETWDEKDRVLVLSRETQDIIGIDPQNHAAAVSEDMAHLAVESFEEDAETGALRLFFLDTVRRGAEETERGGGGCKGRQKQT